MLTQTDKFQIEIDSNPENIVKVEPLIEKIVTMAKKDTLAARRLVLSRLFNRKPETEKIFSDIVPKYKGRAGGYVRIIKMVARKSDGSKMALIEFV